METPQGQGSDFNALARSAEFQAAIARSYEVAFAANPERAEAAQELAGNPIPDEN